jgi:hypothetical protein
MFIGATIDGNIQQNNASTTADSYQGSSGGSPGSPLTPPGSTQCNSPPQHIQHSNGHLGSSPMSNGTTSGQPPVVILRSDMHLPDQEHPFRIAFKQEPSMEPESTY